MKLEFTPEYSLRLRAIPIVKCIHPVSAIYRGRNTHLKDVCASTAKIIIDGKPMCLRHAQSYALGVLIEQKLAEEIK